jgi:hypothetical protein
VGENLMKIAMKLVAAILLLAMGCSGGSWVDLAAFGAPRNCKDLDGKSKGVELAGPEILLNANGKETLNFFARATCSNAGKAWTGDVKCGDTGVQVKCK